MTSQKLCDPTSHFQSVTVQHCFSHSKAVYLLKQKSEKFAAFKHFKALAENVTGVKLGTLRDDKGGGCTAYVLIQRDKLPALEP